MSAFSFEPLDIKNVEPPTGICQLRPSLFQRDGRRKILGHDYSIDMTAPGALSQVYCSNVLNCLAGLLVYVACELACEPRYSPTINRKPFSTSAVNSSFVTASPPAFHQSAQNDYGDIFGDTDFVFRRKLLICRILCYGCPAWTRTKNNASKGRCVTITPQGNCGANVARIIAFNQIAND